MGGTPDTDVPPPPNRAERSEPILKTFMEGTERQRKLAASLLTQSWDQPVLSKKGLLGL
jgi:hypothetical protein